MVYTIRFPILVFANQAVKFIYSHDIFSGFTGKRCENNIDDCARVDCGHGRCVDGISTHACNCTGSGYTGPDCKQDINECMHTGTCLNNATCSNYAGGFLCTCVGDYRGTNCAEKIDDCASNPCKNGKNFEFVHCHVKVSQLVNSGVTHIG